MLWIAAFSILPPAKVEVRNDLSRSATLSGCERTSWQPESSEIGAGRTSKAHPDEACPVFLGRRYVGCLFFPNGLVQPVLVSSANKDVPRETCELSPRQQALSVEAVDSYDQDNTRAWWYLIGLLVGAVMAVFILFSAGAYAFLWLRDVKRRRLQTEDSLKYP
jgi:hypothetical protein